MGLELSPGSQTLLPTWSMLYEQAQGVQWGWWFLYFLHLFKKEDTLELLWSKYVLTLGPGRNKVLCIIITSNHGTISCFDPCAPRSQVPFLSDLPGREFWWQDPNADENTSLPFQLRWLLLAKLVALISKTLHIVAQFLSLVPIGNCWDFSCCFSKYPSELLCLWSPMVGHWDTFVCLLWVLNHREQLWPKSRNLSSEIECKSLSSLARWGATYYISRTPGLWVSLAQRRSGAWSYEKNRNTHSSAAWHLTGCFGQDDFGWRKK